MLFKLVDALQNRMFSSRLLACGAAQGCNWVVGPAKTPDIVTLYIDQSSVRHLPHSVCHFGGAVAPSRPNTPRCVPAHRGTAKPTALNEDISVSATAWCISGRVLGETLRHEVIDRSEKISILRSGPSAPNGGRSSVRMGV